MQKIRNPFARYPHTMIFLIVGVSGVGKSTVVKKIISSSNIKNLEFIVTHTTRVIRIGELDTITYYFVREEVFNEMKAKGELAEYKPVYTGTQYGTSYRELERIAGSGGYGITDIDVDGATDLMNLFPDNVHVIFLAPKSIDQAKEQLKKRCEEDKIPAEEFERRIARFDYEMSMKEKFHDVVTSMPGHPEHACNRIEGIIRAKMYMKPGHIC